MIGGRRRMMMASTKLYDSEVTYIESTGTQYIDTGVSLTGPYEMTIVFSTPTAQSEAYGRIIGIGNSIDGNYQYCSIQVDNTTLSKVGVTNRNTTSSGTNYSLSLVSGKNTIVIKNTSSTSWQVVFNGSSQSSKSTSIDYTKASAGSPFIFAMNTTLDSSGNVITSTATHFTSFKLYSCQFKVGDTLVRDFVPVRKGTTGYLYDKVSGQLFRNQGTGNFVLGNDKLPLPDNLVWVQLYNTSTGKFGVDRYVPIYGIIQNRRSSSSTVNRMGYTWRKNELYYSNDDGINGSGFNSITISGDDTTLFHIWLDTYNRNVSYKDEESGGTSWQSYTSYLQETVELVNGSSVTGILIADADSDGILYFGEAQPRSNPEKFYVRIKQEDYNANGYTISVGERIPAL